MSAERTKKKVPGQYADTPVESLNLEAGVPQYSTIIDRNCLKAREKGLRCPEDHPRYITFTGTSTNRLARSSCRRRAEELAAQLPDAVENRLVTSRYTVPPWRHVQALDVFPDLPGIKGRMDTVEKKQAAAQARINELNADIVIYTDGSASAGCKMGGAAAVITCGDYVGETIMKRGREITCSYEEEKEALELALDWKDENNIDDPILVATDSQSLCQALLGTNPELSTLRSRLATSPASVTIQWIPGHSEITGNEVADAVAKHATTLDEQPGAISYKGVSALINATITDPPISHERTKIVYSKLSKKNEMKIKTRKDEVLLAQLRSGKHKAFGDYKVKLDPNADPSCCLCDAPLLDLKHWLTECDGTLEARFRLFGDPDLGLNALTSHPQESVVLARETLLVEGSLALVPAAPTSARQ